MSQPAPARTASLTETDDFDDDGGMSAPGGAPRAAHTFPVGRDLSGERLDRALARLMPQVSRSRVQRWIEAGAVRVNSEPARARDRVVVEDDCIEVVETPSPEDSAYAPEAMDLPIVWEDESLIVIDKPAGWVVHPGAGNWSGTLANGLLAYDARLARVPRAGIVHRLDAGTSGLMVVARTVEAQLDLVGQLQRREVIREYWALASGTCDPTGTIDAPLARDPRNPLRFRVSRAAAARAARTQYRRVGVAGHAGATVSWLACRLETGRTHQIRVHLESIGHPLIGDPVYRRGRPAAAGSPLGRQALHACRLALTHPARRQPIGWFRPPPPDLRDFMHAIGFAAVDRPVDAFG
ncbi:MAG TPA: RluA family pseudouridine synthase, partial [Burkholderiaceae bacterium]